MLSNRQTKLTRIRYLYNEAQDPTLPLPPTLYLDTETQRCEVETQFVCTSSLSNKRRVFRSARRSRDEKCMFAPHPPTLEQGFASHSANVRSLQIEIYCDFWQHCVRSLQSPLVIKYLCLGHPHFTAAQ